MGCGGSVYQDDGSVKPKAGEVRVQLDASQPLEVLIYWPAEGKKIVAELKKVIAGAEGLKEKWKEVGSLLREGTHENPLKFIWVPVEPGKYQLRFVVDDLRILYPDAPTVALCEKIHEQHEKDPAEKDAEKKFIKMCMKGAEKIENHPYRAEGGIEVCKKDLAALKPLVSAHLAHDNLNKLKEALVGLEDNLPGNMCNLNADFAIELGHWVDEERVLGPAEKARQAVEGKTKEPATARKIALKGAEVSRTVVSKGMDAACKGLGTTQKELLPHLDDLLDASAGLRPGGKAKGEAPAGDAPPAAAPPDPKAVEEARLAEVKALYEADKAKIKKWEEDDAVPIATRKKALEAKIDGAYTALKGLLATPFNPSTVTNDGVPVMARFNGKDMFEGKATGVSANGEIAVRFEENSIEEVSSQFVAPKQKLTVYRQGKKEEIEVNAIANAPPSAKIEDLKVGATVRVRDAKGGFLNQTILSINQAASTVVVQDAFYNVTKDVAVANIFTFTKTSEFTSRAHLLPSNFVNAEFWFVSEEDDTTPKRELNIWREGARDESLQTVALEKRRAPKKATKKEPNPTGDVFVGYAAKVKLLPHRSYCFNFAIGDKFFVNFGKEVPTATCHRRLTVKM